MKPINIGIAGLGRAGWGMHCPELKGREDKFKFSAACDLIPERLNRMAEQYSCKTYDNIEDMVKDPDVELIDIATRSIDHFKHTKLALEAGKDVLIEKPMCVSFEEADGIVKIAQKSKGNLYVRHNRRYEPMFNHIIEILNSGIIGNAYEIKLRRLGYSRRDDWQTIKEFGGGQLLNWGPHIVDHGLRLLSSELKDVKSYLRTIAAVGDAEDHLKVILTGKNDRIVDIEISGGAAISEPEYTIYGTKGALIGNGDKITIKYLDPNINLPARTADPNTPCEGFGSPDVLSWIEETISVNPSKPVKMDDIWDDLFSAIRDNIPFRIQLDEAIEVMKVISLAKQGTNY